VAQHANKHTSKHTKHTTGARKGGKHAEEQRAQRRAEARREGSRSAAYSALVHIASHARLDETAADAPTGGGLAFVTDRGRIVVDAHRDADPQEWAWAFTHLWSTSVSGIWIRISSPRPASPTRKPRWTRRTPRPAVSR
jgi:hypothetical protein